MKKQEAGGTALLKPSLQRIGTSGKLMSLPGAGGTFTLNAQIGSGREGRRMGVHHVSK